MQGLNVIKNLVSNLPGFGAPFHFEFAAELANISKIFFLENANNFLLIY